MILIADFPACAASFHLSNSVFMDVICLCLLTDFPFFRATTKERR